MSPEAGAKTASPATELPSYNDLREQALREAASEQPKAVEEPQVEGSQNVEVEIKPDVLSPQDEAHRLVQLGAQIHEYRRALQLDGLLYNAKLEKLAASASPEDAEAMRARGLQIHSVQIRGHHKIHHPAGEPKPEAEPATEPPKRLDWEDFFPKPGDKASEQRYEDFKRQLPVGMQLNLEGLRAARAEQQQLEAKDEVKTAVAEIKGERREVLEAAAAVRSAEKTQDKIAREIIAIKSAARERGTSLTESENRYIDALQQSSLEIREAVRPQLQKNEVLQELQRLDTVDDRHQLKGGLLETDLMKDIISRVAPSLAEGAPLLLFGETGGAKTNLAKHLAKEYIGMEADVISGNPDVNVYQVMGKTGLGAKDGGTESRFDPGALYTAMKEGRPIILDEIDAMPAPFLLRLNDILLRRPGDRVTIQEDSNEEIIIQPGFCIIATANIKSVRYSTREEMDIAFMQRFRSGAGIERIPYPDHDVPPGQFPPENWRLLAAFLANKEGFIQSPAPGKVDLETLYNFLRAAHTSQRMFVEPASVVGSEYGDDRSTSQRAVQGRPMLDKAVLAPREWMGVLAQVINTDGETSLDKAIAKFIEGQTVDNDRLVLAKLMAAHGFLADVSEESLQIPPGALEGLRRESGEA